MSWRAIFAGFFVLAACSGDATAEATHEQARSSFCGHVLILGSVLAGQPPLAIDAGSALEADVILYELAGEQTLADELRALRSRIEDPIPAVRAFLLPGLDEDQTSAIGDELADLPGALAIEHESQEEAYQRFLELFQGQDTLINAADPEALPASFEVIFEDGTDVAQVVEMVTAISGVQQARPSGPVADAGLMRDIGGFLDRECPGLSDSLTWFPTG